MRPANFHLRLLNLGLLCAGLLCLFPGDSRAVGIGMASSVKKAVNDLDNNVAAQQQAQAAAAAAAAGSPSRGAILAVLPSWVSGTANVMDFRTGTTSCSGGITNCDLYYSGGYFTSFAAMAPPGAGGGSITSGWITDVGPVSGPGAIRSFPASGHEAQSLAVPGHGYVMMLGDSSYAALFAAIVPAPSTGPAPTYPPVQFDWIYPFQPSSMIQDWTLSLVMTGNSVGTVTSVPAGINCRSGGNGAGCSAQFPHGTLVTLTANSATGVFGGWTGISSCGAAPECIFKGLQDTEVAANFTWTGLLVATGGAGSGTVTSNDGKISCGAACTDLFTSSTTVTLVAAPSGTSVFSSWSGACAGQGATCVLTVSGAGLTTTTANFVTNQIFVVFTDTGTGNVTSTPAGINCGNLNGVAGGQCAASFPPNITVTLTATASSAAIFNGWTGGTGAAGACAGTGTCSVVTLTAGSSSSVTADIGMQ